jgi:GntR family transcriptional regulator
VTTADEIAADLRRQIANGTLQPGDRLPSMQQLVDEHGVSRQTARQVLLTLKNAGLAEWRRRRGSFVRARPAARTVRSRTMERDALGYYSGPDVQHWRAITPTEVEHDARVPDDIAAILGIAPGTTAVVRRRLNGDPDVPEKRQLTDSWLHPDAVAAVPVIAGDSGLGGIYDRLEEWAGEPLVWEEESIAATPSPAEVAALLLPAGVPLLRVLRGSIIENPPTGNGPLVCEVNDIRMSGELFSIRHPLNRAPSARWPVAPASVDFYAPTESESDPSE